ncbi:MAG: type II secretion system protein [Alkaliphilus sp.]|nr:type II secretion system F family protein [bacterium AH-315-K05]MBN4074741.1 type II secretion system F family protein [bacterium AH-315-E09]PHS29957.1 MAG: type II secretion system protein [Alkaliphilus sp.]
MFTKGLLFVTVTVFIILLLASKKKYRCIIDQLDKKDYPIKYFLPVGMYMLDGLKYKYLTRLDLELMILVNQIYGIKNAKNYLKIFWANVLTMQFFTVVIVLLYIVAAKLEYSAVTTVVILLIAITLIAYLLYRELDARVKRRQLLIRLDFADLLSKLALLINAGMTISRAMNKIVADNACIRPLYKELKLTMAEINTGKSEFEAYEDFGKRCRSPEIFKFVSIVLQNLRRGSTELVAILRLQVNECWLIRKSIAKQLAEEASSKLLFPMMMMFLAIIFIVMTPAILSMMTM